ncbi:MAG: MFS transporter [Lawsonibacter sp.]|nr:MFS transporter [Lawsonibacter sp.]
MRLRQILSKKVHYAWVICATCALMLFVAMGLCSNVFSIYQPYIIRTNGFTNTQGSLIITMNRLFAIAGMFTVDKLCLRLGLRKTVGIGMCLEIISRLIFAAASTFSAYCVASALSGLTYAWAGSVPITILISHWFHSHRGIAMGIGTTGSGIATVVMPPFVTAVIERYGVKTAFLGEAILTVILACIVLLFVQDRPEAMGIGPYTSHSSELAQKSCPVQQEKSTNRCRLLYIAVLFLAGPAGPGFSHLTVHYTTLGYSSGHIASLMTYLGIALIVGKILCGEIADLFGGWKSNFIIGSALIVAQVFCCLAGVNTKIFPFVSMTLYGVGLPIATVSLARWAQDLTEEHMYEQAVKWSSLSYAIGSFLFSPLPGLFADYTGNYIATYISFTVLTIISLAIIQYAYQKTDPLYSKLSLWNPK